MNKIYWALLLMLMGCTKFEYSPYQTELPFEMPRDLNAKNIAKLQNAPNDSSDTLTVAFLGDSQRFYDEVDDLVSRLNTLDGVDLFILAGDLSDFGLLQEMIWMIDILDDLVIPYLVVVGNHDLATSQDLYSELFGPRNFSFEHRGYKFIFHDTNGREYGFKGEVPDTDWLQEELSDNNPDWFVGVSHVPPFNVDFDPDLEIPYKNLLAQTPDLVVSLHGHLHTTSDTYHYGDGVRYLISNALDKRNALILRFHKGELFKDFLTY